MKRARRGFDTFLKKSEDYATVVWEESNTYTLCLRLSIKMRSEQSFSVDLVCNLEPVVLGVLL
jgi:hypothetical protein